MPTSEASVEVRRHDGVPVIDLAGDVNRARPEEYAAAAAGYFAYAGRWEVDGAAGTVTHEIELSLVPN